MQNKPFLRNQDPYFLAIVAIATIAGFTSLYLYYSWGLTLEYGDAVGHQMIARRTATGLTPGFSQLGTVWPLLPHLIMLPFVANDRLYTTGLGGSIPSVFYYIATVGYVYRTARLITKGDRAGAFIATMFITSSLNLLYMQATPMTEPLLLLCFSAAMYYLRSWTEYRQRGDLIKTGLALLAGTLTRYEGWIYVGAIGMFLLYYAFGQKWRRKRILGYLLMFLLWPIAGIMFWMGTGFVLLGDLLSFMRSDYAKPSNWVQNEAAEGHVIIALKTYILATIHVASWPGVLLGLIGLTYFLYKTRGDYKESSLLTTWFPIFFFVIALYLGQRPMHVPEISGDSYNERFALQMLLPITLVAAYLARERAGKLLVGILVISSVVVMLPNHIVTLNEPIVFRSSTKQAVQEQTAEWFSQSYDGRSLILMENYGNEIVQSDTKVLDHSVYEGTYKLHTSSDIKVWGAALKDPARYNIEWIYARKPRTDVEDYGDKVYQNLHSPTTPTDLSSYTLVFENSEALIYRRTLVRRP